LEIRQVGVFPLAKQSDRLAARVIIESSAKKQRLSRFWVLLPPLLQKKTYLSLCGTVNALRCRQEGVSGLRIGLVVGNVVIGPL
jgi:hypothetical protein